MVTGLPSEQIIDREARRRSSLHKWTKYSPNVLPAFVAEHDFAPPKAVTKRLTELIELSAYGYHDSQKEMIDSFCRWTYRRHNWSPNPDLVRPITNCVQGVWASVMACTQPGQKIILSDPVYYPFQELGSSTAREVIKWNLHRDAQGWHYDLDALKQLLETEPSIGLIVLCHPQNPTGYSLTTAQLKQLVDLSLEHNLTVISDEIHYDLVHPGNVHIPTLTIPGASDCTITVTSGVKTFATGGLRCAVAVFGNEILRDQFATIPEHLLTVPNRIGCEASTVAWDTGDAWVTDLREVLNINRCHLLQRLEDEIPGIRIHPPDATFLAWLDLSAFSPGEKPSSWLRERTGVACEDGPKYGLGGKGHVRFNFGTSMTILDEMIDRLVLGLQNI